MFALPTRFFPTVYSTSHRIWSRLRKATAKRQRAPTALWIGPIELTGRPVYNNSHQPADFPAMDHRDPIVVIDQTLDNLVYLVEWWLEDLDVAVAHDFDLLTRDDAKTISALRATRALLPRLRIVRSNYESAPALPDAHGHTTDHLMADYIEQQRKQLRRLIHPRRNIEGNSREPARDE